jgi:putative heme-binding domain-containing protein
VLGRTLTLPTTAGKTKRMETQLLHYDGRYWQAYTYQWRDDESDADLVDADGTEKSVIVDDPRVIGGKRELTWSFASRAQCLTCHSPWAETTLAFNTKNINLDVNGKNQLLDLCDSGLLKRVKNNGKDNPAYDEKSIKRLPKHEKPFDAKANLEDRARSYLHVNCSHCHRNGGGGGLTFELTAISDLKMLLDVKPSRGDFGLTNAKLVAKGEPFSSTLLYRMAKFGRDRMPHIGAETPDHDGLKLITEWIYSLGDSKSKYKPISTKPMAEQLVSPSFGLSQACVTAPDQLKRVIKAATTLDPGASRELFEGYLPPGGERKLGPNPRPKAITSLKGDAVKGKALFLSANLKCIDCHKLGDTGKAIGPDLAKIGAERSADELLESLLLPSRRVEPAYQSYILKSVDGQAVTGVLVKRDAKTTTLKDATDKLHTFANADIDEFKPARESLMPSGVLNDLTPQQAADLLEFLKTSGK